MKIVNLILVIIASVISIVLGRNHIRNTDVNLQGGIQRDHLKNIKKPKPTKFSKYEKDVIGKNLIRRKKRVNKKKSANKQ